MELYHQLCNKFYTLFAVRIQIAIRWADKWKLSSRRHLKCVKRDSEVGISFLALLASLECSCSSQPATVSNKAKPKLPPRACGSRVPFLTYPNECSVYAGGRTTAALHLVRPAKLLVIQFSESRVKGISDGRVNVQNNMRD
jgi:hypothetical protein